MKFKYFKPTLVLLTICLVVTFLLSITYKLTYVPPVTDPDQIVQLMAADYLEVLPGSDHYKMMMHSETYDKMQKGEVVEIVSADIGYAITVHSMGQYSSDPIRVLVGISNDGTVTGVKLLAITETPGMGMKAQSETWLKQFVGGRSFVLSGTENTDNATEIDGITAATKSSKAIMNAVNMALESYKGLIQGENAQ